MSQFCNCSIGIIVVGLWLEIERIKGDSGRRAAETRGVGEIATSVT